MRTGLYALAATVATLVACGGSDGDGPVDPGPTTGTVSGAVTAEGAGVAGAEISLPGKTSQSTSSSGAFTFTQVSPGTHTLSIGLPDGFALGTGETAQKSTTVTAGQTATVNWSLRELDPPTATVDTVRLSGTSFSPSELTVSPGRTVVWVNTETMAHTVTPDGHSAWSRAETSSPGEVLRVTFNNTGTFNYFCEPHVGVGMTGRIVVQ